MKIMEFFVILGGYYKGFYGNNELIKNYRKFLEILKKSEKSIDSQDNLMNLDSFIKEYRLSWKSFVSFDKEFSISLQELNQIKAHKIIMLGDEYELTFDRINDSSQYQIKFTWLNYPSKWRYDLKLTLYLKSQQNIDVALSNEPKVILSSKLSEILHTFNINDLLRESNESTSKWNVISK